MRTIRIAAMLTVAGLGLGIDDRDEVRSVLRRFNEAVSKPEIRTLRALFSSTADYRDAARTLKGPDAIAAVFADRQVWSERTPPLLKAEAIRLIGSSVALVDANLVQYGSTIMESSAPVVLLLEKNAGNWEITSWRMFSVTGAYVAQ